MLVKRLHK